MKIKNKFFLLIIFTVSLVNTNCDAGLNSNQILLLSMVNSWSMKSLYKANKLSLKYALADWLFVNAALFICSKSLIKSSVTLPIGNCVGLYLPTPV